MLTSPLNKVRSFYRHSVIRNASLLLASNISMAGLGFLFWIVVAHVYTRSEIGVASVILTALSLITTIGLIGLDSGIVRFLSASSQKEKQYQSTIVLVSLVTAITAVVYVAVAPILSSKLEFLHKNFLDELLVVMSGVALAINAIVQSSFISERRATFVLRGNLIFSVLKIGVVPCVAAFGALGIIFANSMALLCSLLFGTIILARRFGLRLVPRYSPKSLHHVRRYAATLVISGLENSLVVALVPLLVLNRFGAETAAVYYIVISIASVLNSVASSTFQSLLAEGSHDPMTLVANIRRSLAHVMTLLIPIGLVLIVFGRYILNIFGTKYSLEGTTLLRYFAIAAPFSAMNYLADGIANVLQKNRLFLAMNSVNSGLIILFSVVELRQGLNGLGEAWLAAQLLTLVIYILAIRNEVSQLLLKRRTRVAGKNSQLLEN